MDLEGAKQPLHFRSVFLEANCVMPRQKIDELNFVPKDMVELCDNLEKTKRRIIKSHLPFEFLPPQLLEKCKAIVYFKEAKILIDFQTAL